MGLGLGLRLGLGFLLGLGIWIRIRIGTRIVISFGLGLGSGLGLDLFFMKTMSLGIPFSDILGFDDHFFVSFCVSGTSFDVFGVLGDPWGVQVSKGLEHTLSRGRLWAPFRVPCLRTIVLFLHAVFDYCSGCLFYCCLVILGAVLTCVLMIFCNFSKTAVLWKIAPRLHASSIFRVWRVRERNIFVFFGVWFLDWFGNLF